MYVYRHILYGSHAVQSAIDRKIGLRRYRTNFSVCRV